MRSFEYLEPTSVAAASAMLADHGEECRLIAGGTALILALRQRMLVPTHLISIASIEALRGISYTDGDGLRIGALSTHAEIAASPIVQRHCPMLAEMAALVANPQVRNQGTIGGNLCYADPATDPPTCLLALAAKVVLAGRKGERVLDIDEFLVDYFTTALAADEMVTEIRIRPVAFTSGRHVRFLRTAAEHRPLVNVAVTVRQRGDICEEARIVVGASVAVPKRVNRAEAALAGKKVTKLLVAEIADIVAGDIEPISDLRGQSDYRREMVRVTSRRLLEQIFGVGG